MILVQVVAILSWAGLATETSAREDPRARAGSAQAPRPGAVSAARGSGGPASEQRPLSPPGYRFAASLPSIAVSLGGYVSLSGTPERFATTLDVDCGARLFFGWAPISPGGAHPILALWPVGGYSLVTSGDTHMHLATLGLGFGVGAPTLAYYQGMLSARAVLGTIDRKVVAGARVELQFSVATGLGVSLGYQVLVGHSVLHGIRILAMLDLGSIFIYWLHIEGAVRTRSSRPRARPRIPSGEPSPR